VVLLLYCPYGFELYVDGVYEDVLGVDVLGVYVDVLGVVVVPNPG
jgi:hypothetical protein